LGLFGAPAFLAEKVLGNVVSSGVKVLVLAVTIDVVGQFARKFNSPVADRC
jgi:type IV secretion system protein TrbL